MQQMIVLIVSALVGLGGVGCAAEGWRDFAVATVHPLASEAALQVRREGGNAVDAAVAAALVLGVVDGHNSGLGGGALVVLRTAKGEVIALDGRELSPRRASPQMYRRNGELDEEASKSGALAVAVPGALRAYELMLEKHGSKTMAEILAPIIRLAREGFAIDGVYARKLQAHAAKLRLHSPSQKQFFRSDDSPLREGDRLVQEDLARSLEAIAQQGSQWFYHGRYAQQVEAWMRAHGGLLDAGDFAQYEAKWREPLRATYRGVEVVAMPPPSSGGVHVLQMLEMLERFDLRSMAAGPRAHVLAESMKLAFADRAHWLGDPDHASVPRGLLDAQYLQGLSARIDEQKVGSVPSHGMPPRWQDDVFGKHTTFLCTADKQGNWVAINQTVNTAFGSKVIVPGTGIILNNEMDDFALAPGVANAFGLVGAQANAVGPRKRPLSSMSPTLLLREGRPWLVTGAAGGPTIITQVLQLIIGCVDLGLSPQEALLLPRVHHQWRPSALKVEDLLPKEAQQHLRQLGHQLEVGMPFGACQAIGLAPNGKSMLPAHDPRIPGLAAGR